MTKLQNSCESTRSFLIFLPCQNINRLFTSKIHSNQYKNLCYQTSKIKTVWRFEFHLIRIWDWHSHKILLGRVTFYKKCRFQNIQLAFSEKSKLHKACRLIMLIRTISCTSVYELWSETARKVKPRFIFKTTINCLQASLCHIYESITFYKNKNVFENIPALACYYHWMKKKAL